ncbi:hypothetical protein [Agromyces aureus]|uniref:Uncharacterized protein n=1 Tax=Agromyces aureus TaxID=453304 RepID=A0A191WJ77_9MICO|nr:hypothetical protein [Agromyces aureus]ANJ28267.1 hypothetical protein ATC03_17725 [Agromyces aureus]
MRIRLVTVGVATIVLAIVGVVLVVVPGQSASFGWFAYQAVGDFGFVGGLPIMPVAQRWGWALIAVAAVISAFATGWVLGGRRERRRTIGGRAEGEAAVE